MIDVFNPEFTIKYDELPGLEITTTLLNVALPGIEEYYGTGIPVDVFVKILKINDFEVSEGDQEMSSKSTFQIDFLVHTAPGITEEACSLTIVNNDFSFTALVDNLDISLNISKVNIESIIVNSCAFGTLSALKLRLEINNGLKVALKFINPFLAKHSIPFPGSIIPLFQLHDLSLDYFNDYIYAGMSVTFVAPAAAEAISYAVQEFKDLQSYTQ